MGWFEVINTGLNVANTAASINVASNVNKMQQRAEQAEMAARERGEMLDLVDRVNRRMRKLHSYMESNPRAAIVLCEFYDRNLKAMGAIPSRFMPEDRHILRDVYEKFEDQIETSKSGLTEEEISQAYDCLDAIIDLPVLEAAIKGKETRINNTAAADQAVGYLSATESEWQEISKPAGKAQNRRTIGIILLALAVFATCFIMPFILGLPFAGIRTMKYNFWSGLTTFGTGMTMILLYLTTVLSGIALIVKSKIPNADKYQQLLKNRNNAIRVAQARNTPVNIDARFADYSLEHLQGFSRQKDEQISAVLGKMADFNKLFLLPE